MIHMEMHLETMGSKLGQNYACLLVTLRSRGVEERMLSEYSGTKPDLYKSVMDDDVAGAASCTEEVLRQFLPYVSNFHPKLDYSRPISTIKLPFLDIYLIP